jgi:mannose-6-phosphate isomerase-like protein (cupin superfamily)
MPVCGPPTPIGASLERVNGARVPRPVIRHPDPAEEFSTPERCSILESWNDESDRAVSIARARVEPGVTTQLHTVTVDERYLIVEGRGVVAIGDLADEEVRPGDVVVIPAGTPQQITNTGTVDLVFYCVCSPRFTSEGYAALE